MELWNTDESKHISLSALVSHAPVMRLFSKMKS